MLRSISVKVCVGYKSKNGWGCGVWCKISVSNGWWNDIELSICVDNGKVMMIRWSLVEEGVSRILNE